MHACCIYMCGNTCQECVLQFFHSLVVQSDYDVVEFQDYTDLEYTSTAKSVMVFHSNLSPTMCDYTKKFM